MIEYYIALIDSLLSYGTRYATTNTKNSHVVVGGCKRIGSIKVPRLSTQQKPDLERDQNTPEIPLIAFFLSP